MNIVNESISRNIKLHLSTDSTITDELYDELFDMTYNGIEIETVDDETPFAWDASIDVQDGQLVISGEVGPGGFGSVLIKLPVIRADDYYNIFVEPIHEYRDEVIQLLMDHSLL